MSESSSSARRVVITGIGVFSPCGIGVDEFHQSLLEGRSGIAPMTLMDYSAAPGNVGGEISRFTDETARKEYLRQQRKSVKVMCREIQLGVASALQAVEHARLETSAVAAERFGVDFGANLMFSPPEVLKDACWSCVEGDDRRFHFEKWGREGLGSMEPLWLLRYLPNMPACHIGIAAGACGPNNSITLDEASANLALGEARRIIERGAADVMIAGSTGTRLHPVKTLHAALWDELADSAGEPATWCRPFDRDRTGQVIAEGACSFILEDEEQARRRGATIYGTILGSASACVSDREGRAHRREALVHAMQAALRDAGMQPGEIGHVNAHGLSTRVSDREEAAAFADVFGEAAREVPVTALKSYFGNAGSGCGSLELAGSLLMLQQGAIPPTLNFQTPDPECPLNVVHGEPLPTSNRTVLKISVTRMGQAAAVIVAAE